MILLLARDEIKAKTLLQNEGVFLEANEEGYQASDHEKACEILKDNYILFYAEP